MSLENLAYSFFGNNLLVGRHIKRQLAFLRDIVPPSFQRRRMDDLGCGDGKTSLLLRDIFRPTSLRGFDVNPGLVTRARSRGIDAEVGDLNENVPTGELAVLWGVLHHLRDRERCLGRLKENYPLIFIREPVKAGFINFELGQPLELRELVVTVSRHIPESRVHYCENGALIFYACPGYGSQLKTSYVPTVARLRPELNVAGRHYHLKQGVMSLSSMSLTAR